METKIVVFDSTLRNEFIEYEFRVTEEAVRAIKEKVKSKNTAFSKLYSIVIYLEGRTKEKYVTCSVNVFFESNSFGFTQDEMLICSIRFKRITDVDLTENEEIKDESTKVLLLGEPEIKSIRTEHEQEQYLFSQYS